MLSLPWWAVTLNESIGMFTMKAADGVSALGIGFARDTARIDDADVGRFFFFGRQTSACSESVAQRGRFGVVEFATQRHESRFFVGDDRRRWWLSNCGFHRLLWNLSNCCIFLIMSSQVVCICIHIQVQNYGYLVGMPNFERVSCEIFRVLRRKTKYPSQL